MSVQDDKAADRDDKSTDPDDKATDRDENATDRDENADDQGEEQRLTEKPEPDEKAKKKAAEMMEAYKEKPTIVLPGTGGSVSGTAVNEWLDEDGNPKNETPDGAGSDDKAETDEGRDEDESRDEKEGRDEKAIQEQVEKDKALNVELRKASEAENKGEEG
jgi:hypothetical protein